MPASAPLAPPATAVAPALDVRDLQRRSGAVVAGSGASAEDLAVAVALALGDLLLAAWIFARTHRRALAAGLIARYRAETVT